MNLSTADSRNFLTGDKWWGLQSQRVRIFYTRAFLLPLGRSHPSCSIIRLQTRSDGPLEARTKRKNPCAQKKERMQRWHMKKRKTTWWLCHTKISWKKKQRYFEFRFLVDWEDLLPVLPSKSVYVLSRCGRLENCRDQCPNFLQDCWINDLSIENFLMAFGVAELPICRGL